MTDKKKKMEELWQERNHFKALYEHEKDISGSEIRRLDEESRKLLQELVKIQDDTQDPRTAKELAAVIKKYSGREEDEIQKKAYCR